MAPHLLKYTGILSHSSWLLLSLCVTLCGNITATSSIAGYIINDEYKKVTAELIPTKTWLKVSIPSVIISLFFTATFLVAIYDYDTDYHV